jgi:hypothetical protein
MGHLEAAHDGTYWLPGSSTGIGPLIENRRIFWPPASAATSTTLLTEYLSGSFTTSRDQAFEALIDGTLLRPPRWTGSGNPPSTFLSSPTNFAPKATIPNRRLPAIPECPKLPPSGGTSNPEQAK